MEDYGNRLPTSSWCIYTPPRRYIFTPPLTRDRFAGKRDVDAWIKEAVALCREKFAFLFDLTANEREFLVGFLNQGEIDAALLDVEPEIYARIEAMPMPAWKSQLVRRHGGLGLEVSEVKGVGTTFKV